MAPRSSPGLLRRARRETISMAEGGPGIAPEADARDFGDWRVWFSWGGAQFNPVAPEAAPTIVPPAWHLRRREEQEVHVIVAQGLAEEELRARFEEIADAETAEAIIREFQPREEKTHFGRILGPRRG